MAIPGVVVAAFAILIAVNMRTSDRSIGVPVAAPYAVADPQFARAMGSLLGHGVVPGNRVTALHNGDAAYPAMLAAIRAARVSITFEQYIFSPGTAGRQFAEALSERARAGVPVHVILDWSGSRKIDAADEAMMVAAGVQIAWYRPLHWYSLDRINHRTHRKILVVDGRVGFTGGMGISDEWLGDAQSPEHWRDTQYRIEGPATAQLQATFMDNWIKSQGEALHDARYFPAIDSAGGMAGQVTMSSASHSAESIRLMFLLAVASARSSIRIANAYFVPDDMLRDLLIAARRRGVEIDVLVPGEITDARVTQLASQSRWEPLLAAGVRIHEYGPTMYHCKVMIVDDLWVSVGSANLDSRAFRLNDEANLSVYDSAFATAQTAAFRDDLSHARLVTLEEWRRRPLTDKVLERLAGLLRSQL